MDISPAWRVIRLGSKLEVSLGYQLSEPRSRQAKAWKELKYSCYCAMRWKEETLYLQIKDIFKWPTVDSLPELSHGFRPRVDNWKRAIPFSSDTFDIIWFDRSSCYPRTRVQRSECQFTYHFWCPEASQWEFSVCLKYLYSPNHDSSYLANVRGGDLGTIEAARKSRSSLELTEKRLDACLTSCQ